MQPCSKCLNPAGDEAVQLKNGLYMCPTCYQRTYTPQNYSQTSERFYVSVEAVLALVLTFAGLYGCYVLYNHHVASERAEALERQKSAEAAEKRRLENIAAAEVDRKRNEAERTAREAKFDADRKAQRAAEKADQLEREQRAEARRKEQEQTEKDEQAKRDSQARAEVAERERLQSLDRMAESRKRAVELEALTTQAAELAKTISTSTDTKATKQKSMSIHNVVAEAKKKSLISHLEQYGVSTKNLGSSLWERDYFPKNAGHWAVIGSTVVIQESTLPQAAAQATKWAEDIKTNLMAANKEKDEIDKLTNIISDSESKRANMMSRITELKALDAEAAAREPAAKIPAPAAVPAQPDSKTTATAATPVSNNPVPNAAPQATAETRKPGFKTIYKKDGTTIQAKSTIKVDNELRYRDEKGDWHVLNAGDIEKVEVNEATK